MPRSHHVAGLPAAAALALATAGPAAATPVFYECQHPTTTGMEAFNVKNMRPHRACVVVRKLAAWLREDYSHYRKLYHCKRPAGGGAGIAVLNLHRLFGWHLRITKSGDFRMSRGSMAFSVGGTDFPVNCS